MGIKPRGGNMGIKPREYFGVDGCVIKEEFRGQGKHPVQWYRLQNIQVSRWAEEELPSLRELRLVEEKSAQQALKREVSLDVKEWSKKALPDLSEVSLLIAEHTKQAERRVAGILALGLLGLVSVVTLTGLLDASRWQVAKEVLSVLVPLLAGTLGYYFGASRV